MVVERLTEIFHQNLGVATVAQLGDALFSDLAHTFTGETELVTNLFETFLVATNAETLANDCYLAVFQHLVEHRVEFLIHLLMVYLLVGAGVIAAWHDIEHAVVLTVLKRSIDAHMVTICHEALSDLLLVNLGSVSKLRH